MNAPHTPGPLHVTREVDAEGYAQHTVRTATGSPVAVLSNYAPLEQKANADLYAAAPRMLAALCRTESNLSRLIAAKHSDEVLMTPWRDEIRALIAEAEGRSLQEQAQ